jgi:haloacetate dehalogenase
MGDFTADLIETGETTIFARRRGSGPPVLLLHGFPQSHLMWRDVAPRLAPRFTVVCPDLRGQSGGPASTPDHAPYAKRAMGADMVATSSRRRHPSGPPKPWAPSSAAAETC